MVPPMMKSWFLHVSGDCKRSDKRGFVMPLSNKILAENRCCARGKNWEHGKKCQDSEEGDFFQHTVLHHGIILSQPGGIKK